MSTRGIDFIQEKQIRYLFGIVAFLGGLTTILVYMQDRHSRQQRKELDELERELKLLQLAKLRAENKRNGY